MSISEIEEWGDFGFFFLPTTKWKLGSHLGTITILCRIILYWAGVGVGLQSISSLPGLHLLDAISIFQAATIKIVSRHCQMTPGGQNGPAWAPLIKTEYSSVFWTSLSFPALWICWHQGFLFPHCHNVQIPSLAFKAQFQCHPFLCLCYWKSFPYLKSLRHILW